MTTVRLFRWRRGAGNGKRTPHPRSAFHARMASPMAIDEVQRGGNDVVLAVKSIVDSRNSQGQFVLAGSTRFLSVPQLSESLAGRSEILDLWPFSQGEILGVREGFLNALLADPDQLPRRRFELVDRRELFDRLVRGGFSELVDASSPHAARWYRNYVRTVVERDIGEKVAPLGERIWALPVSMLWAD